MLPKPQPRPRDLRRRDLLAADRPNPPTLKTATELPTLGSVVINVQGDTFDLPTPNADVIDRAADMATEYRNLAYQAHRQHRSSYAQRFNDSRFNFTG